MTRIVKHTPIEFGEVEDICSVFDFQTYDMDEWVVNFVKEEVKEYNERWALEEKIMTLQDAKISDLERHRRSSFLSFISRLGSKLNKVFNEMYELRTKEYPTGVFNEFTLIECEVYDNMCKQILNRFAIKIRR